VPGYSSGRDDQPKLACLSIPAGALADSLTEQGILLVSGAMRNGVERVESFAEAVEVEAGMPIEEFITHNVRDATKREFLGHDCRLLASSRRRHWCHGAEFGGQPRGQF
jgi:hypothetical protein